MDDLGLGNTWRAVRPEDYARLREAALRRAEALRREASLRFWRRSWALVLRLLPGRREVVATAPARTAGGRQHRMET